MGCWLSKTQVDIYIDNTENSDLYNDKYTLQGFTSDKYLLLEKEIKLGYFETVTVYQELDYINIYQNQELIFQIEGPFRKGKIFKIPQIQT